LYNPRDDRSLKMVRTNSARILGTSQAIFRKVGISPNSEWLVMDAGAVIDSARTGT
jgi:hypothetical protein